MSDHVIDPDTSSVAALSLNDTCVAPGLLSGSRSFRVARIPPEANASVNTSRLIVTYLAAEQSMPPFFPGSPALPPESR
jgi:hypothetical protein